MLAWGNTANGQLGCSRESHLAIPQEISSVKNIPSISNMTITSHSSAIVSDGLLFTSGSNDNNCLGRGGSTFQWGRVDFLETHTIVQCGVGEGFMVALTNKGKIVSWGRNEVGQLAHGHRDEVPIPRFIKSTVEFVKISTGQSHTLALSTEGDLYTWGANSQGQLGDGLLASQSQPTLLKALQNRPIVSVACGSNHCLALTVSGTVYSWGNNSRGQCGLGDSINKLRPQIIKSLKLTKIATIAAGDNHSVVIGVNGRVFSFGSGIPLGHGSRNDELSPRVVERLQEFFVSSVACGSQHTIFRAHKGDSPACPAIFFGCGQNSCYQLSSKFPMGPVFTPTVLDNTCLSEGGTVLTGGNSTVYLSPSFYVPHPNVLSIDLAKIKRLVDNVLAARSNSGSGSSAPTAPTPSLAESVKVPQKCDKCLTTVGEMLRCSACKEVYYCSKACQQQGWKAHKAPCLERQERRKQSLAAASTRGEEETKSETFLSRKKKRDAEESMSELRRTLDTAFSSASVLNASFLNNPYIQSNADSGVDIPSIRQAYRVILDLNEESVLNTLGRATLAIANKLKDVPADEYENLRVFLVVLENPLLLDAKRFHVCIERIISVILGLAKKSREVIFGWLGHLHSEYFAHIVRVLKGYIKYCLSAGIDTTTGIILLDELAGMNKAHHIVPSSMFYVSDIPRYVDLEADYANFRSNSVATFSFCKYSNVIDVAAKRALLKLFSKKSIYNVGRTAVLLQQEMERGGSVSDIDALEPFLRLSVKRETLVIDCLNQLAHVLRKQNSHVILSKELKVHFEGELGIDEGGLRKELFQELIKAFFQRDSDKQIFQYYPDTGVYWFQRISRQRIDRWKAGVCKGGGTLDAGIDEKNLLYIFGVIIGLALYNGVLINLNFPLLFYKLLLKDHIATMEDLTSVDPHVAANLRQLLNYKGGNFVDTFGLTFDITVGGGGDDGVVDILPLCSDGENRSVTSDNRQDYAALFLNHLLLVSVEAQYKSLVQGFGHVMHTDIFDLFNPLELDLVLCGTPELGDFSKLREGTVYGDGYSPDHHNIKWFWNVLLHFPEVQKKQFLEFVTGNDRTPLQGLESLGFTIVKSNASCDFLPVSHTCFNVLELPVYESENQMFKRLTKMLEYRSGFGIV